MGAGLILRSSASDIEKINLSPFTGRSNHYLSVTLAKDFLTRTRDHWTPFGTFCEGRLLNGVSTV